MMVGGYRERIVADPLMAVDLETVRTESIPCRETDLEIYFSRNPQELDLAKDQCYDCPLMFACEQGARDRAEPWGVWGGQIFVDGFPVQRKRGRGRPKKDAS